MLLAFSKQRPGQPPTKNGPALGVSRAKAEKCKPPREMLVQIITRTAIISTADTVFPKVQRRRQAFPTRELINHNL